MSALWNISATCRIYTVKTRKLTASEWRSSSECFFDQCVNKCVCVCHFIHLDSRNSFGKDSISCSVTELMSISVIQALSGEACDCMCNIHRKTPMLESILNKKRLQHRCFFVNIVKFLRTPFLKNICLWLLLWVAIIYLRKQHFIFHDRITKFISTDFLMLLVNRWLSLIIKIKLS